ncbi:MAG: TasA family protein, partial [Dethiobacteria bacterium]|nr:TasA family protein [Dethiobacteria bacterium]
MPKIKIFMSLAIVILAVALIGGATLAWFTAATDPIENVFVAGTVDIEAGWQSGFVKLIEENWNPGDCSDLGLCVINEGTKAVKIRAKFDGFWTPGTQRMLVIY